MCRCAGINRERQDVASRTTNTVHTSKLAVTLLAFLMALPPAASAEAPYNVRDPVGNPGQR
ncbi:MAG: hypothetical protein NFCOHLIN_01089 [Gammaproteobacteria bacterium]|nr:hypothetical protein [Gammaproteobacteria bacterium]